MLTMFCQFDSFLAFLYHFNHLIFFYNFYRPPKLCKVYFSLEYFLVLVEEEALHGGEDVGVHPGVVDRQPAVGGSGVPGVQGCRSYISGLKLQQERDETRFILRVHPE